MRSSAIGPRRCAPDRYGSPGIDASSICLPGKTAAARVEAAAFARSDKLRGRPRAFSSARRPCVAFNTLLFRLDIFRYGYISHHAARTHHHRRFQCRRRAPAASHLDLLARGERPVNDIVDALDMGQPQLSKHLRVLREVGLVHVREDGRRQQYRLNARPLKSIHDWVTEYESAWEERFEALDEVLDHLNATEAGDDGSDE